MSTSPRVWMITGASSGLGLDTTRYVLQKGDIAVATVRKPEVLDDLKAQYAGRLLVLKVDVTVHQDIIAAFKKVEEAFGRLDVVVSNAGVSILGEIESTTDEAAHAMFEVNFWGATHVLQESVRFMREVNQPGKGGRIIQITSGTGIVGYPACGFYSASKHAMEGLTETLAAEVDPAWNIKVSIITLGAFRTNAVATGMVKLPLHPAYANSASATSRKAILASLTDKMDPAYQVNGDTAKAAGVLYRLSELPSPPVRLVLNCVELARNKIASFSKELEDYASWSEGVKLN
ncbi:NAD-P-binding protein [Lentinus tigrinus ALCF2SS1-7]|uniref:NAD-P-binding protein n=1 Tax=Lentinus tigrinus ALCF2SS1-6 TaxID=1328759 RepID=A0A5C2RV95_9APHY|nr:NAD-P-binding protein [Lentinus tigrinus ALCF2SS1-6]RPD70010.1 NAD-P-binding protein [Lentinus tigrinus ALCF2SS1-7]